MQCRKFRGACRLHDLFRQGVYTIGDAVGLDIYRIEAGQRGVGFAGSGLNHQAVYFTEIGEVFRRHAYATKSGSEQRKSRLQLRHKSFEGRRVGKGGLLRKNCIQGHEGMNETVGIG